ncbi:MAG: hypothetical protein M1530_00375 [Candidatus Marsarchaeota archaeon]|nr:hypothetical protein [Candidatus Marsarchaeota archaeon]
MVERAGLAVFGFLLLLLSSSLSAEVLLSRPSLGERLEVLVENESAPANLTLVAPNGTRIGLALTDGQASYLMDRIGRWEVRIGERRWNVTVGEGGTAAGRAEGGFGQGGPLFFDAGLLAVLGMVLVLLALAAAAVYYLVLRAPAAQEPMLERRWRGGEVSVRLRAGTRPLEKVVLEDEAATEIGHARRLRRARLAAGQSMEMRYETGSGDGEARASFELDGRREELAVREGVSRLERAKDEVKLAEADETKNKKSSEAAERRRLKRADG